MKTELLSLSPVDFCDATNACPPGRHFALKHATMAAVWDACPRVEWLSWMLDILEARRLPSDTWLFATWCVRNTPLSDGRTTWDLLTDPRSRTAVEVAERFARGEATEEERSAARIDAKIAVQTAADSAGLTYEKRRAARAAAWAAHDCASLHAPGCAEGVAWCAAECVGEAYKSVAMRIHADEFRRRVPNPFTYER